MSPALLTKALCTGQLVTRLPGWGMDPTQWVQEYVATEYCFMEINIINNNARGVMNLIFQIQLYR